MWRALKILGLALRPIVIISAAAFGYFLYAPSPPEPALTAAVQRANLRVGERDRSYLAYAPAKLPSGAPLLIVLHGSLMTGEAMRAWTAYEFDELADQRGFVVMYPDGFKGNWNDCRKDASFAAKAQNIDDMGFLRALISRMVSERGVDPKKVYLFGYSNGGHMAFRVASEAPEMAASFAAVAANLPTPDSSSCQLTGSTPRAMLVEGTEDPINPYAGGAVTLFGFSPRGQVLSAVETARAFAAANGATGTPEAEHLAPTRTGDPTTVDTLTWTAGGKPVTRLYTANGSGHVIPQPEFRFYLLLGRVTSAIDTPKAAVAFFGL
jgi:polyhydroxybutyrate depolymerase